MSKRLLVLLLTVLAINSQRANLQLNIDTLPSNVGPIQY